MESGTFEGICKYCGTTKIIMAKSQEEADYLISESCTCNGAEEEAKIDRVCLNAKTIAEGYDHVIGDTLATLGCFILKDIMQSATLNAAEATFKVSKNSKGQVKFTRKEVKQQELQD